MPDCKSKEIANVCKTLDEYQNRMIRTVVVYPCLCLFLKIYGLSVKNLIFQIYEWKLVHSRIPIKLSQRNISMKKLIPIFGLLMLSSCSFAAQERPSLEYNFPICGQSILNEKNITKVCATRDFIALEPRKRKRNWLAFLAAEGSGKYYGPIDRVGGILEFKNQELDMQGHVWDFSKQGNPSLVFRGYNSIIKNGNIINTRIYLGGGYRAPNFSIINQKTIDINNLSYAKKDSFDKSSIEVLFIDNININGELLNLSSWGGGISNSNLILKNNFNIEGSKATILNNKIISNAELETNNSLFPLIKLNKSNFIAHSQQIFPDANDDTTAIPSALYVKFSPDTVIDGNTFTLTQRNDQAYAIVLDHSPRVRITNNTFNGFKVPILMDQWSSIVDEKGKEIKPEQFTGYGNIINPNEFAGHVTMNRKGEIVRK